MIQNLLVEIQIDTERRATTDNRVEREEILGVARPDALDPQELRMKGLGHIYQRRYCQPPGKGSVEEDT